jgi:hypothetical protein
MDESVPMSEIMKNQKENTQPMFTAPKTNTNGLSCTSALLNCGSQNPPLQTGTSQCNMPLVSEPIPN